MQSTCATWHRSISNTHLKTLNLQKMKAEVAKKKCSKCLQDKEANRQNFYRKPDGQTYYNVCRACKLSYGSQRHAEIKNGTFVKTHRITVVNPTGKTKTCSRCEKEKDEVNFREYATRAKSGKKYFYRANRCRDCEAENEKDRRFEKDKFDENAKVIFNLQDGIKAYIEQLQLERMIKHKPAHIAGLGELINQFHKMPELVLHRNGIKIKEV